jgi:hypothetical protein
VIEFVGSEERIKELLPVFKGMVTAGAMVLLDAQIVHNVCEQ